jgi:hypothetical protein
MPSFRDNLLTWLFFTAAFSTAIVDFTRSREQLIAGLILSGVVYIAGAWAAVGEAHRLARGAAIFVAPLAAALPFYLITLRADEAGAVLAVALIASVLAYVASLTTKALMLATRPRRATDLERSRWRYSLSEILGWMVVTAIASVAVSKAKLPEGMAWELVLIATTGAVPSAAIIALFLAPQPPRDQAAMVVSAIIVVAWFVAITAISNQSYYVAHPIGAIAQLLGFVACWILCMRLDRGALNAKEGAQNPPTLKLHDAPSHDE